MLALARMGFHTEGAIDEYACSGKRMAVSGMVCSLDTPGTGTGRHLGRAGKPNKLTTLLVIPRASASDRIGQAASGVVPEFTGVVIFVAEGAGHAMLDPSTCKARERGRCVRCGVQSRLEIGVRSTHMVHVKGKNAP